MAPASPLFPPSLPRTKLESGFQEGRTIVKFSSEAKVKKQEPKYVFLTKLKAKHAFLTILFLLEEGGRGPWPPPTAPSSSVIAH